MLLRFLSLIALAAAVFFLVNAGQPVVDQNRKVHDWPAVEVSVFAKLLGGATTAPATTAPVTTAPAAEPVMTAPATTRSMTASSTTGAQDVLIRYRHEIGGVIY